MYALAELKAGLEQHRRRTVHLALVRLAVEGKAWRERDEARLSRAAEAARAEVDTDPHTVVLVRHQVHVVVARAHGAELRLGELRELPLRSELRGSNPLEHRAGLCAPAPERRHRRRFAARFPHVPPGAAERAEVVSMQVGQAPPRCRSRCRSRLPTARRSLHEETAPPIGCEEPGWWSAHRTLSSASPAAMQRSSRRRLRRSTGPNVFTWIASSFIVVVCQANTGRSRTAVSRFAGARLAARRRCWEGASERIRTSAPGVGARRSSPAEANGGVMLLMVLKKLADTYNVEQAPESRDVCADEGQRELAPGQVGDDVRPRGRLLEEPDPVPGHVRCQETPPLDRRLRLRLLRPGPVEHQRRIEVRPSARLERALDGEPEVEIEVDTGLAPHGVGKRRGAFHRAATATAPFVAITSATIDCGVGTSTSVSSRRPRPRTSVVLSGSSARCDGPDTSRGSQGSEARSRRWAGQR